MCACAADGWKRCGRSLPGARSTRRQDEEGAHQSERARRRRQLTASRYGWVVVAAAFALMSLGFAAAYSFAAFFSAFEAEFGASRGDIALVFSVAAFIWFLLGAPGVVIADRFGPRRVALLGVACLTAALGVLSAGGPPGAAFGRL